MLFDEAVLSFRKAKEQQRIGNDNSYSRIFVFFIPFHFSVSLSYPRPTFPLDPVSPFDYFSSFSILDLCLGRHSFGCFVSMSPGKPLEILFEFKS